jgi:3-carboxy-cis,cis-muconate cycloisomerase
MFEALFSSPEVAEATGERAWVGAMLDVEAAAARVAARLGLIPPASAAAIDAVCRPDVVEVEPVWRRAVDSATPVVPLVDAVRAALPAEHARHVHAGLTSQDVVDTAMMLVARRALAVIDDDLGAATARLAGLAAEHADTPHLGRTLLQPARPTTFGAVCRGWRTALDAARTALGQWRPAIQLGGPVGDRAGLDDRLAAGVAEELGLADAPPWHTDRGRVVQLGAAAGVVAGSLAKIATDVVLLSQAEIGELREGAGGRSSAMPDKRNPARSVLVIACAHRLPGLVSTLLAGLPQELQRAAGRWQAEWPTVTDILRLTGGAARHARVMLAGLIVDADRMRARL